MTRGRTFALLGCALALAACRHPLPTAKQETAPAEAPAATPTQAPAEAAQAPAAPPQPVIPPAPVPPRPVKVKITVRSIPPKAKVSWGRKKLGVTPVFLYLPRDSGPVDLVVRSDGFFPIHVRAYTFHNDALTVRMTKLEDRLTLFGAKHEPEPTAADVDATGPVAGMPGAPAPPPSLAAPGAPVQAVPAPLTMPPPQPTPPPAPPPGAPK